ncbi:MAG: glycoside hydrolase family 88 protein [Proteiniphilum sp.]|nr:glycoside hydrolase family 88 protein [Proteiniphilum sp.]HHT34257.1 hypothetical protein [Bacteroidales bacterium]MDD2725912.1 glycoside hydrolase family 88 protein [Proteiniphilum sp.]MDD3332603.1 glycoside hydrolase family 88 protein [Proteiniphilum sp.]MDD3555166.1 glycoside hydrolase family 88 protein [Proteiniphilum sp.]
MLGDSYFRGRDNRWAQLTLVETLDVVPAHHHRRNQIIELLHSHISGLAVLLSGDGFCPDPA